MGIEYKEKITKLQCNTKTWNSSNGKNLQTQFENLQEIVSLGMTCSFISKSNGKSWGKNENIPWIITEGF